MSDHVQEATEIGAIFHDKPDRFSLLTRTARRVFHRTNKSTTEEEKRDQVDALRMEISSLPPKETEKYREIVEKVNGIILNRFGGYMSDENMARGQEAKSNLIVVEDLDEVGSIMENLPYEENSEGVEEAGVYLTKINTPLFKDVTNEDRWMVEELIKKFGTSNAESVKSYLSEGGFADIQPYTSIAHELTHAYLNQDLDQGHTGHLMEELGAYYIEGLVGQALFGESKLLQAFTPEWQQLLAKSYEMYREEYGDDFNRFMFGRVSDSKKGKISKDVRRYLDFMFSGSKQKT